MSFWSLFPRIIFSILRNSHLAGSVGNKDKVNTAATAPNLPNDQNGNLTNNWEKIIGDQANIGTDKISGIAGNIISAISGMCCHQSW